VTYEGLMPVPADPPDGGSLIIVGYNKDYIPAILLALEVLKDAGQWLDPPEDLSNLIESLKLVLITALD